MSQTFTREHRTPLDEEWPVLPGTIHPESKTELFANLRVHPQEFTEAIITPFVPKAGEVDQDKDRKLFSIARILADTASIHNAATYAMEHEEWDFMAVYYDAIDHFSHAFMKYHPPLRKQIPENEYALYKDVVAACYRYHDMMLERLLELAGEDTTVMLVSDHGFHPDHLRPDAIPKEPAGPAVEHSPYGIICIKGPGIKKDERIYGASVLDVTPTLLSIYGLPVGQDMDGKVLTDIYEHIPDIQSLPSWEDIPGLDGAHPEDKKQDPYMDKMALDQLIQLGYVEEPDPDKSKAADKTLAENRYYLARSYADAGRYDESVDILDQLINDGFREVRYHSLFVQNLLRLGRVEEAIKGLEDLKSTRKMIHETNRKTYAEKIDAEKRKHPEKEFAEDLPPFNESPVFIKMFEAWIMQIKGEHVEAIRMFEEIGDQGKGSLTIRIQLARSLMNLKRWSKAEEIYKSIIEYDPAHAVAWHGLGVCALRDERFEDAIDHLLESLSFKYYSPFVHYHLGEALYKAGDTPRAIQALEVALKIAPGAGRIRDLLIEVLKSSGEEAKAAALEQERNEVVGKEVMVVTGFPRSGTSMMMQILEEAGVPIFTDKVRSADESNPKGYYEHELVKQLGRNKAWLHKAAGKAVKVVAPLLPQLPQTFKYRLIYMERDLDEILQSQHRMLVRDGKAKQDVIPLMMKEAIKNQMDQVEQWLQGKDYIDICRISYKNLLDDPEEELRKLMGFLDLKVDLEPIKKVIDPSLYRERQV